MKKRFIPLLSTMILMLTSCNFYFGSRPSSENNSSSESSVPSEESSSETPSSEEISSEPSSSEEQSSEPKTVKKHQIIDQNTNYVVGDNYWANNGLKVKVTYTDNTFDILDIEGLSITTIREKSTSKVLEENTRFVNGGEYEIFYSYTFNDVSRSSKLTVPVLSGYEAGLELEDITISGLDYIIGKTILETSSALTFVASWANGVEEKLVYADHVDAINLELFDGESNVNVINNPIEQEKDYTLKANIVGYEHKTFVTSFSTPLALGYYKFEQGEIIYSDFATVSPHEGDANMLVILIEIPATTTKYTGLTFDDESLEYIDQCFFGDSEDNAFTLKSYYEQTSLGKVNIQGIISDVYRPDVNDYSMEVVKESHDTLHQLFNDAIKYTKENSGINDWSEYDLNKDGYFDNLHFITNAPRNNNFSNDTSLWPHKWEMYRNYPGTNESPNGYVYETSSLGHFEDARTIIHEQGHMFGIPDYYDYSYSGADYIGGYDMQSHNVMDWNSWSKLSVGWSSAYVIDGTLDSTTISLRSAALYNECLIVPANVTTYNNSAFDEFFLIELFTSDANNEQDWYKYISTTVKAGIRLYHVDARLYNSYSGEEVSDKEHLEYIQENSYSRGIDVGVNNSYKYSDYANPGNPAWSDYKMLALIQKGGTDTFGNTKDNNGNVDFLTVSDLFRTGDQFTFAKYKHFLSKSGARVTTMDNGETFPYTIDFVSVTKNEAVIKISK